MRKLAIVALVFASGCAERRIPIALTPLGMSHVPEHYRYQSRGSAIVLPMLDCTAAEPDLQQNILARHWAATRIADGIWQALELPGPAQDGRIAESADLCRELSDNAKSGANIEDASPTMRERLRDYFNRYPEKTWLIAVTRYLRLGHRVPGPGPGVGALAGQVTETDTIEVSAYVFTKRGDVAYRADMYCSAGGADPAHDCGPQYEQAPQRIAELLEGFPRAILRYASFVKVPPANGLPPPKPPRAAEATASERAAHAAVEAELSPASAGSSGGHTKTATRSTGASRSPKR